MPFNLEKLREIKQREAPTSKRPRVMLVEDEPANLRMMAALLERDYEIIDAADGHAAWEMLQNMPDRDSLTCIISDQRMPRMAGVELLERAQELLPKPVRMIVTGFMDVNAIVDSINKAGIYKFIVKPFDATDFQLTVRRAVESFQLQRQLEEQRKALEAHNESFSRFVPSEFLEHLDRPSLLDVQLGDNALREMTIFFADIVDFTTFSEGLTPQENFDFLNSYLSRVGPVIRARQGFVDKYMGDGVMGLFPRSRRDALDAALDFRRELEEYNAGRARAGYQAIDVGIGLHCGALMLGTIGEAQRMDTTVISDAVNVAARLERLTRTFRVGVIVSDAVIGRLSERDKYSLRPLGSARVRGRGADVAIFELFDADEPSLAEHKSRTAPKFAAGLEAYGDGRFDEAGQIFAEIAAAHSDDGAAAHYRTICEAARPSAGVT